MSLIDSLFPKSVAPTQVALTPNGGSVISSTIDPIQAQDISVMSHLDSRASAIIAKAYDNARSSRQTFIEADQLLLGLLSDREVFNLLQEFSVDAAVLSRELESHLQPGTFTGEPTMSEESKQVMEEAFAQAKSRGVEYVSPEDILLAMLSRNVAAAASLKQKGLDKQKVEEKLSKSSEFKTGKKSMLAMYGIDLTAEAKAGKLDPVTGRDREIARVVHILLRRTKNNPIIIGEAGVGKTAIVEGLAQMIAAGKVASDLAQKRIIQIDVSSLIAGASHRGEFEERLQNVIKEALASSGQVILFIDEIHTLIGAGDTGGAMDASNIIKPYLTRGQLQVIGTTTTAEYRRYFEKDRAFERRFQPIMCDEPSEEVAGEMIKILQPKYEAFHKLTFAPDAMVSSVHLSKRYIGERYLPDKAIDLMDEAGSEVRLEVASGKRSDNVVHSTDIEKVVSGWTGIPITKLTEKESDKLLHLEELIHKKFIDHDRAVQAVAEAVRRGRIGLANANRPIASFIFLGPTGTGKTELAKVLAEIMFGRTEAMIRLDMSEYMEKHEVAKLVGAPPGYVGYEEGGQLTEAVRAKPYSIVLLDEIEKAHPDVFNILLQLLEDGRLTDNKGNTVSFKNTIIIATSNIGSNLIRTYIEQHTGQAPVSTSVAAVVQPEVTPTAPPVAAQVSPAAGVTNGGLSTAKSSSDLLKSEKSFKELSKIVNDELTKFFKPELLNRFDEVVMFEPLTMENMLDIARLGVENTRKLLKEQNIDLQMSQTGLAQLAKEGYDPVYGARPLRRLIQRSIENPIAIYLINRSLAGGDSVIVDFDPNTDKFVFRKVAGATPSTNSVQTAPPGQPGIMPPPLTPPPNTTQPFGAIPPPVNPVQSPTMPSAPPASSGQPADPFNTQS